MRSSAPDPVALHEGQTVWLETLILVKGHSASSGSLALSNDEANSNRMLMRTASPRTMPDPPIWSWRTVAAMLAFCAGALLLMRPFCQIGFGAAHAESGHAAIAAQTHLAAPGSHDAPQDSCCATIMDGTLVKAAQPMSLAAAGSALGAALLLGGFPRAPVRRSMARTTLADPSVRSYYARSARILR